MVQEVLRSREASTKLTVRDLALISGFGAILVIDGYASSLARLVTHNTDTFFLMATFFTILAVMTRKHWTSTVLAVITGAIFLAVPGAPVPIHITGAVAVNGLVFDLTLLALLAKSTVPEPNRVQLALAGTLGNGTMAAVILPFIAVFVPSAIPVYVWPVVVLGDAFVGLLGVSFGYSVVKRFHNSVLIGKARWAEK